MMRIRLHETLLYSLLVALCACSGGIGDLDRPTRDPSLAQAWFTSKGIDFDDSRPLLLGKHHVDLLRHFAGIDQGSLPDELTGELTEWNRKRTREQRRDPASYHPNGFPKGWSPSRTWYAGEVQGLVRIRYATIEDVTYAIGAFSDHVRPIDLPPESDFENRASLGWSSTIAPSKVNWIESSSPLPKFATMLTYDAVAQGREIVIVCEAPGGLRELVFEAQSGVLVERRRRLWDRPGSSYPMLVEAGGDVLLFWMEHTAESSRFLQGGVALRVSRRVEGSSEWSEPKTLTIDLGVWPSVCVNGDQVTAAWPDNRFQTRDGWKGFKNSGKLCVATSPDRGVTWSPPVLLHDPEAPEVRAGGIVYVFDDGAHVFVATTEGMGYAGGTFVLSRDLRHCLPASGDFLNSLTEARRKQIVNLGR